MQVQSVGLSQPLGLFVFSLDAGRFLDSPVERDLREHYHTWPEEALPSLGCRTFAAPKGRARVAQILQSIQDAEERNRAEGRPWYDVPE